MRALFVVAALIAAVPAAYAQDFDPMEFADGDHDGKVTAEEYTQFSTQGWGFISQGADKVKPADLDPMMQGAFRGITPDAEGYVTQAAYVAAIPTRFKAADTNGDGTLSSAELSATFAPPK